MQKQHAKKQPIVSGI